ncbi:hypothetical protein [Chryseobacterium hagamense]|uniref:Exostosin GT47 domain-containing protein n=1 Tax=Chryseobacterium hagamense TaxID=395935 RepID=A0A511YID1_9FLAO|nr:hypothetical protein [Chryseobacterium hagamense]GEN74950.1 hypothetical protein CHA01nite_06900 [Chryseobacterium hagamense]
MINKRINQVKRLISDTVAFLHLKLYIPPENDKVLLISFTNPNLYHRFFYLMVKFYQLSGYTICYPMNFSRFRNLRNKDRYLGLMVREKNFLSINKKNLPPNVIELKDEMFSPDYFVNYFEQQNKQDNVFHVPMSFHPFMYNQGIWDHTINTDRKRFNSIFCYGNFDEQAYLDIKRTEFTVETRTGLLAFFQKKENFISIRGREEVISAGDTLNEKYVFAIKENYGIRMEDIRELLSRFNFYLCCPGVVMPLCHNVIEAMSVGTIPLIQKEYAEVMYPNLRHRTNAVLFKDLNELEHLIHNEIFKYSGQEILTMKNNVLEYYKKYLSPAGMVKNLNQSILEKKLIYLQAEHRSVKFIK